MPNRTLFAASSWLNIPKSSPFSLANIPFGIISHSALPTPHPAVAVGDYALDLQLFTAGNGFSRLSTIQPHSQVFSKLTLNAFAALGRPMHDVVRKYLQGVLLQDTQYPDVLKDNAALRKSCLIPLEDVTMHLPMQIGDYTDFFAGQNHAFNCGVIFRGAANALQPNYKHLPVGYHGRASSVVVSGTPIRRPCGQILENPAAEVKRPIFAPCRRLDMELELAAFVCKPNAMGEPVPIESAEDHLFGVVLMNDWSARDIQAWEYVPLGPFNAKNFGTTISPWVVLMSALEPFRVKGIENDTELLPYLRESQAESVYDINLSVLLKTASGFSNMITRSNARHLLFSFPQMLAHHTSTGCPMNVGDLLGSGTISGTEPGSHGSFLEQTSGAKQKIQLNGGEERMFIEDGDEIIMRGTCGNDEDGLVGFGDCKGVILPALQRTRGSRSLRLVVHYLYHGELNKSADDGSYIMEPSQLVSAKIWVFGDKYGMADLRNVAATAYTAACDYSKGFDYRVTDFVYENCPHDSTMRRIMVKYWLMLNDISQFEYGTKIDLPRDCLQDLIATLCKFIERCTRRQWDFHQALWD